VISVKSSMSRACTQRLRRAVLPTGGMASLDTGAS
jgi:hypothetical protein